MISYLSYFQIFSSMFTSVLLFFFPALLTYKQMAIIIAVISSIVLFVSIFKERKISYGMIITTCICILTITLYFLTYVIYQKSNSVYNSFFLVLSGQVFPIVLCATLVAQSADVQHEIKRLSPICSVIFSFIAFFAAFFPTSVTTGGYVSNINGLNYQSTSYLAAYAAAFGFYYLLCFEKIAWHWIFQKRWIYYLIVVIVFVDLLVIFISGGRGGLVLYISQVCLAAYVFLKKERVSGVRIFKFIGFTIFSICMILLFIRFATNTDIKTNGFERILHTVNSLDTNGRDVFWDKAIPCFLERPLFGHGLGSVFYEIGIYTHNCVTDALVEIGMIGCLIYLLFLFISWEKGVKQLPIDYTDYIWLIIYLDGFIMSLFSGYYICQIPVLWASVFILCRVKNVCKK